MRRLTWLAGLLVLAIVGLAAPPAEASTYWWYGKDNTTCRQIGFPGGDQGGCSFIGADFLDTPRGDPNKVHIRSANGGVADMAITGASGEYCFHHNTPAGNWDVRPTGDQSPYTDFRAASSPTATDFYRFAQADHFNNRCQAHGTQWGQHLYGVQNNSCVGQGHEPCGLTHYTSFATEGGRNKPWDRSFGPYPTLNLSITANPKAMNLNNTPAKMGGAWGYACVVLKDTTRPGIPYHYLEYCFEEWNAGRGYPNVSAGWASYDLGLQCQSNHGIEIDQVIVRFDPSTKEYATPRHGTAQSYHLEPGVNGPEQRYHASITRRDMERAIARSKSQCAPYRGGSPDPADWALVGVEQGIEAGDIVRVGGNSSGLELSTVKDTLSEGDQMTQGQQLFSGNGLYRAQMQNDGNFVVYSTWNNQAIWNTPTYGANNARLVMQWDDNLVMYNDQNQWIWRTDTQLPSEPKIKSRLVMQNDGNLVLYQGGRAAWSSREGKL